MKRLNTLLITLMSLICSESTISIESFGDDPWYSFGGLENGCNGKGTISDAITLPDDRIVIIGSDMDLCGNISNNGLAIYDPDLNEWMPFPGFISGGTFSKLEYSNGAIFIISASLSPSLRVDGIEGAHRILMFNLSSSTWTAPADVIDNTIECIAIDQNHVFIGGAFDVIDGITVNNVAMYMINEDTWMPLGDGTNGRVDACDLNSNYFYIGGFFSAVDGIQATKSAAYNLDTLQWRAMGSGFTDTNAIIHDIVGLPSGAVYVGSFDEINGESTRNAASWEQGTSVWTPLPVPQSSTPMSVDELNGEVYSTGLLMDVLKLDTGTNTWINMGDTYHTPGYPNEQMLHSNNEDDLLVFGNLELVEHIRANAIAQYSPTTKTWTAIGSLSSNAVTHEETNDSVGETAVINTELWVGGNFVEIGGIPSEGFATWDGARWKNMSSIGLRHASAFAQRDNVILVSGDTLDIPSLWREKMIMSLDHGSTWQSAAGGVRGGNVFTMETIGNYIYVGGNFDTVSGIAIPSPGIARFNTLSLEWEGLNSIDDSFVQVFDIHALDDKVYIAGDVHNINNIGSNGIIAYDTTTNDWNILSDTTISSFEVISTLDSIGGLLIVGGNFNDINGVNSPSVALYNPTTQIWSDLNQPFSISTAVGDLFSFGEDLYVGGDFSAAIDSNVIDGILKWNSATNTWSSIKNKGIESQVANLIRNGTFIEYRGLIYFGGTFDMAGEKPSRNISAFKPGLILDDNFE